MPSEASPVTSGNTIIASIENAENVIVGDSNTQIVQQTLYSRSQKEELDDYVAHAMADYERTMYAKLRSHKPTEPYKFLFAFEIEDRDIFFGRKSAVAKLYSVIGKDRLTVLHARSGGGKTSLLQAGLGPTLLNEGRLPIYIHCHTGPEDLVTLLKHVIAPPSLGSWPTYLSGLSFAGLLGLLCRYKSASTSELVIIFDQFEHFYIFNQLAEHRTPFIDAFSECYAISDLPVRYILSVRKDYYSDLAGFQPHIPCIFYNEMQLGNLDRDETESAILEPLTRVAPGTSYSPQLLQRLIDDLTRIDMTLPHLQVICTRLFEGLGEAKRVIDISAYEMLGGVKGVLGSYLKQVLLQLPDNGENLAWQVLKELVSSRGTRRALTLDTLARRVADVTTLRLDSILSYLVDARLLRRDTTAGNAKYELAHDYLIDEIAHRFDPTELRLKQAQELLDREVVSWKAHHHLVPRDRLEILYEEHERLGNPDVESLELLVRSAFYSGFAASSWLEALGSSAKDILFELATHKDKIVRDNTIMALSVTWQSPKIQLLVRGDEKQRRIVVEELGTLVEFRSVILLCAATYDIDADVRQRAARALEKIKDNGAIESLTRLFTDPVRSVRMSAILALAAYGGSSQKHLLDQLSDTNWRVRAGAVEALGLQKQAVPIGRLVAALSDEHPDVRLRAVTALGAIGKHEAVEPLLNCLADKDYRIREHTAKALGLLADPRAAKQLVYALGDEISFVRAEAARALGRLGDPDTFDALQRAFTDIRFWVRINAIDAMVNIDRRRAVQLLQTVVTDDPDFQVRSAARHVVYPPWANRNDVH